VSGTVMGMLMKPRERRESAGYNFRRLLVWLRRLLAQIWIEIWCSMVTPVHHQPA